MEKKEEELLSKMRVQEQRVTQIRADLKKKEVDLQKKEDDFQQMMTDVREQFRELSMQREVCVLCVSECVTDVYIFSQKRPPRIKRFSPRKLIEWLTRKGGSSMSDEATSTTTIVTAEGDDNGDGEVTGKERVMRRTSSKASSKESGYNPVTKEFRRKGQDLVKQPPSTKG